MDAALENGSESTEQTETLQNVDDQDETESKMTAPETNIIKVTFFSY